MWKWLCSWFSSSEASSREKWSSEMEQESFTFEWRLRNVAEFLKFQETIESPIFVGGSSSRHHWRLSICQRSSVAGEEMLEVSLELVKMSRGLKQGAGGKNWDEINSSNSNSNLNSHSNSISNLNSNSNSGSNSKSKANSGVVKAYVRICCLGPCETLSVCNASQATDFKEGRRMSKVLPKFRLLNAASGLLCFKREKSLTLHCHIVLAGRVRHLMRDECGRVRVMGDEDRDAQVKESDGLQVLSANWSAAFKSGLYTDVTISCKHRSFAVHKIVLAAQSSVFSAMFLAPMTESVENLVEIEDFDEGTVKSMLEYLYAGQIASSTLEENATELLRIADKYEIAALKEDCERVIVSNLSAKNAMEILILSHFHSPVTLKRKIAPFLRAFKKEIQRTEAFKKISRENATILEEFNGLVQ